MTSGNASDSICPRGWSLPVNGGDSTNYSWQKLLFGSYYNLGGTTKIANSADGSLAVRAAPLSVPFSGVYNWAAAYLSYRGSYGYFWSRTAGSQPYARFLSFSSSSVYPQDNGNKVGGFTVRCVAQ